MAVSEKRPSQLWFRHDCQLTVRPKPDILREDDSVSIIKGKLAISLAFSFDC